MGRYNDFAGTQSMVCASHAPSLCGCSPLLPNMTSMGHSKELCWLGDGDEEMVD